MPWRPDILAVDGGNSKVDVALVAADGTLLGAGRAGGASFAPDDDEQGCVDALLQAVRRAGVDAGADADAGPPARLGMLCLAGADLPVDDRRILRALRPLRLADDMVLHNDTFAVLRAGTERSWGVGVVCGAGMNCSAVAPNGRTVRFAAIGEVSGDEGGGGWLGTQAIRAAVRGHDGRDPHTVLEREVPAFYGVRSVLAVLERIQTGRTGEYPAELAPLVFRCAAAGDAVSQRLVDRQADEDRGDGRVCRSPAAPNAARRPCGARRRALPRHRGPFSGARRGRHPGGGAGRRDRTSTRAARRRCGAAGSRPAGRRTWCPGTHPEYSGA